MPLTKWRVRSIWAQRLLTHSLSITTYEYMHTRTTGLTSSGLPYREGGGEREGADMSPGNPASLQRDQHRPTKLPVEVSRIVEEDSAYISDIPIQCSRSSRNMHWNSFWGWWRKRRGRHEPWKSSISSTSPASTNKTSCGSFENC